MHSRERLFLVAISFLTSYFLPGGARGETAGACTYTGLVSGAVDTLLTSPSYSIANQTAGYWTAVAIRSDPGSDWDVQEYKSLGTLPACVDSFLTSSTAGSGVDVIVEDFNHQTPSPRYLESYRAGGAGSAVIEWDDGTDVFTVNGDVVFRNTGPNDVVECWDVYLQGGKNYGVELHTTQFAANMTILLFRNPTSAPYSVGRVSAVIDTSHTNTISFQYTPPADDWYALVVVNENGNTDVYTLELGTCLAPTTLASGTSVFLSPRSQGFSFNQTDPYWTIVAIRPDLAGFHRWKLTWYAGATGVAWPSCFSSRIGFGYQWFTPQNRLDYIVGNFNAGGFSTGTYYVTAEPWVSDTSSAVLEWDAGADILHADGSWTSRTTDASDVTEIWDILLNAYVPYVFTMVSSSTADIAATLASRNYGGYPVLDVLAPGSTSVVCTNFTVDSTAYHGLATLNTNGGSGSYQFSVAEQFIDEASPLFQGAGDAGGGLAWADYDLDGDLDVYIANMGTADRLLQNDGAGVFIDATMPPLGSAGNSIDPSWADFDNDGDPDLLVVPNGGSPVLYRNDGPSGFVDVTVEPLGTIDLWNGGSWADFDRDGLLDLLLIKGNGGVLLKGAGDGTFTQVFSPAIDSTLLNRAAWGDYDDDGDLDLFLPALFGNKLIRNDGLGRFADVTAPPLSGVSGSYDAAWGDYDQDGDIDLAVAGDYRPSLLYRNDGGGIFYDASGLLPGDTLYTRGIEWLDFDNDGALDLFLVNYMNPNQLLGAWTSTALDWNSPFTNRPATAIAQSDAHISGAWIDHDGDGDVDLSVGVGTFNGSGLNRMVRNDLCWNGPWLNVDLTGVVSNRDGLGARVTAYSSGKAYAREINGKGAGPGSEPYIAHFGLPAGDVIDSVTVWWPLGARQTVVSPSMNQTITITEATSDYVGVEGAGESAPGARLALHDNVPNPFNPTTTIRFELPAAGRAELAVYDVAGRRVRTLSAGDHLSAGIHEVVWDGTDGRGAAAASGIYFYRLRASGASITKKMMLIR